MLGEAQLNTKNSSNEVVIVRPENPHGKQLSHQNVHFGGYQTANNSPVQDHFKLKKPVVVLRTTVATPSFGLRKFDNISPITGNNNKNDESSSNTDVK